MLIVGLMDIPRLDLSITCVQHMSPLGCEDDMEPRYMHSLLQFMHIIRDCMHVQRFNFYAFGTAIVIVTAK